MDECSYDGCARPARRGNTICKTHQIAEWRKQQGPCSLEGCGRPVHCDGICSTHYRRRRDNVPNWDAEIPERMKRGGTCSVDGCERAAYAKGHCGMHYNRVNVLGHVDAGPAARLKARAGEGSLDKGYRIITVDGQRCYEHRWVMEQMLGRPLEADEEVHHRNRIRDDNEPSNLELWCTPQPRGGRVEDLVAFYVERYPEVAEQALRRIKQEVIMGTPSMQGVPAASAAQGSGKSFPADTDPGSIPVVPGLPDGTPQMVGSPVQPDIRQVTPVADMGAGYREADPATDPW